LAQYQAHGRRLPAAAWEDDGGARATDSSLAHDQAIEIFTQKASDEDDDGGYDQEDDPDYEVPAWHFDKKSLMNWGMSKNHVNWPLLSFGSW
jgi:hypothetical protein